LPRDTVADYQMTNGIELGSAILSRDIEAAAGGTSASDPVGGKRPRSAAALNPRESLLDGRRAATKRGESTQ